LHSLLSLPQTIDFFVKNQPSTTCCTRVLLHCNNRGVKQKNKQKNTLPFHCIPPPKRVRCEHRQTPKTHITSKNAHQSNKVETTNTGERGLFFLNQWKGVSVWGSSPNNNNNNNSSNLKILVGAGYGWLFVVVVVVVVVFRVEDTSPLPPFPPSSCCGGSRIR
jgi:hypothetical protein